MSSKNLNEQNDRAQKKNSASNPKLKSSIVHKPFPTGTVNIFNTHRSQSSKSHEGLNAPKLFLNAELEDEIPQSAIPQTDLDFSEVEYRDRNWSDSLLSPWGISAIAIIFFTNLVSGAIIWRNSRTVAPSDEDTVSVSTVGNANLTRKEFMPLNLSTLSMLKTAEDKSVEDSQAALTPIPPALAPLNNVTALSSINPQYYYVLSEYAGDRSLSIARQKTKQVSLVNLPQGVFIYLGAFTDKEQANEFVSQLKQENFPIYIYPLN